MNTSLTYIAWPTRNRYTHLNSVSITPTVTNARRVCGIVRRCCRPVHGSFVGWRHAARGTSFATRASMDTRTSDVFVENHGSIFLFQPLTAAAEEWIAANVSGEPMRYAGALVVEPRYARDLAAGMLADGLHIT